VSERAGGRLDMVNMAPVAMERGGLRLRQGEVLEYLEKSLEEVVVKREGIQRARSRGALSRRLGWPLAMLALIALTSITLYLVATNMMLLAAGWRSLPSQSAGATLLGTSSLSTLGVVGVVIEVVVIAYLFVTSIVGLYSIPQFHRILPKTRDTSMTNLILNCALYVILSSALPLLVKVLGITNFDLLGNFGRIRWLGNYFIIFGVNIVFGGAAAVCLFNKVTHRAQVEIWRRLTQFLLSLRQQVMDKLGPVAKSLGLRVPPAAPQGLVGTPLRGPSSAATSPARVKVE